LEYEEKSEVLCEQDPRLASRLYSNDGEEETLPSSANERGWYVAYTRPRQEYVAESNLSRQAFETYLPLYKKLKKARAGARRTAEHGAVAEEGILASHEPMFPRYLFFRPSCPKQSIAAARSSRGVSSLVAFGAQLACVTPEVMQTIRAFEERRNSARLDAISPFQPGTRVRLRDSALHGLEGLVHAVTSKRVLVLMELLGQQHIIKVEHDRVEHA
jgi:transcriptional antiterminator RfaH